MESFSNPLFSEGQMILTYVIPDFLLPVEICRFACTCKFARDAMRTYSDAWAARLKVIADRHGMKICRDSEDEKDQKDLDKFYIIDKNYQNAIANKRLYRVKGTNNVFRMFCHDGIGTAAELRGGWAWTSDTSYYTWVKRDDTMFTNPIPLLKTVCWYDPVLSVKYVDPGSYSLFLRHGLQPNHNFVEKTNFTVKLQAKRKDTNELIKENTIYSTKKFMSEDEANHLVSLKCFDNTFICQFNTDNTYKLSQETGSPI